uniref:SMP-30/Gluconolactonase/LRE-like region domain-containing protein n=2 Tax=Amphimedon queenslandica TaxID=400682 RepID=A0A1X7STZ4_AMPQE
KFSPDGKFVGQFGTKRSGPGQLICPVGITIDTAATGLVYVSEEWTHHISVFTSDGVFVSKFGSYGSDTDQFDLPIGLAFNKDGFLYVCDLIIDNIDNTKRTRLPMIERECLVVRDYYWWPSVRRLFESQVLIGTSLRGTHKLSSHDLLTFIIQSATFQTN